MRHDSSELIGMECTYNLSEDLSEWNDENTIRCKITSVTFYIEDKWPYDLSVGIGIIPIGNHDLDADTLNEMQYGVSVDSLMFFE